MRGAYTEYSVEELENELKALQDSETLKIANALVLTAFVGYWLLSFLGFRGFAETWDEWAGYIDGFAGAWAWFFGFFAVGFWGQWFVEIRRAKVLEQRLHEIRLALTKAADDDR